MVALLPRLLFAGCLILFGGLAYSNNNSQNVSVVQKVTKAKSIAANGVYHDYNFKAKLKKTFGMYRISDLELYSKKDKKLVALFKNSKWVLNTKPTSEVQALFNIESEVTN